MRTDSNSPHQGFTFQLAALTTLLVASGLGCSGNSDAPGGGNSGGSNGGSIGTSGATSAPGGASAGGAVGGLTSSGGSSTTAGSSGSTNNNSGGGVSGNSGGSAGASGSATAGGAGGSAGGGGGGAGAGGAGGTGSALNGPPMGWASWNSFASKIDLKLIKAQADAMVSSGLKAAGYQYVNIDEGWWQGARDASGNITIDSTTQWPGGMQAAADYIHSLGLKAGIYTDAGKAGCGFYYPTAGTPAEPNSGAEGHYDADFLQFEKWGFDFVKVDWCGGSAEGLNAKAAYQGISDSIKKATVETGRPMTFSVCNWGGSSPWDWAPAMSTMWRTSGDIIYYGSTADITHVFSNFDTAQHPTAQSPGHYNDPDMLIVGMPNFSLAQNRTHFAMWAISGAPLLAGNKLDSMTAEVKGVLTNSEVIAIDQDPLAKQGAKVSDTGGLQVYNKVLSGTGRHAVLLLNRSASAGMITVKFADIGLGANATVRDVWAASDLGMKTTSYGANVPSNDSLLLLVTDAAAP